MQNLEGGVAENGDFRQGGQDALYPALSGGGVGAGSGGLPSGITFGRVARYP